MVRIHTECNLELTGVCRSNLSCESEDVAFTFNNLTRIGHEYLVVALCIGSQHNKLNSYCIVKTLLINSNRYIVLVCGRHCAVEEIGIALNRENLDSVPLCSNLFFPLCKLTNNL